MKRFEEFLATNDVRNTSPDLALAKSLRQDAEQSVKLILSLELKEESATLVFEQVYEAIRACADALLAIEGFKSYSHLATISFLAKYSEMTMFDISKLDNAGEKRNLSRYYAKQVTLQETRDLITLYAHLKPKLDAIFKRKSEK